MDPAPVLLVSRPFFRDAHRGQIQHFQQAVISWKYGFGFGRFPQLTVKALDGIRGVDEPSDRFRILESGGEISGGAGTAL